jgi:hypothetical protein
MSVPSKLKLARCVCSRGRSSRWRLEVAWKQSSVSVVLWGRKKGRAEEFSVLIYIKSSSSAGALLYNRLYRLCNSTNLLRAAMQCKSATYSALAFKDTVQFKAAHFAAANLRVHIKDRHFI